MKEIPFDELKQIELDILKNVAEFCDANGIRYFLAYGTLLGAIRHKGFIPWDDDIDIIMPRPDYDRFIEEYSHGYYKVWSIEKDPSFSLNFAKVTDERTACLYPGQTIETSSGGFWIDIFPMDGLPDEGEERHKYLKKVRFWKKIRSYYLLPGHFGIFDKNSNHRFLRMIISYIIHTLTSPKFLAQKLIKIFRKYNYDTSNYCAFLTEFDYCILETQKLKEITKATFEDAQFNIPEEYDYVLTKQYGDYMTPPPEEERINTHQITGYWK